MGESDTAASDAAVLRDSAPLTLEAWAVGTFDVVAFGLVLVVAGHATGALADALSGLGTLPGLALFGYLWALAVAATRWALGGNGLAARDGGVSSLLQRGAIAGAAVGVGFLLGPVLVGGAGAVLTGGVSLVTLGIVAGVGSLLAGLVGSVVGVVFVLFDLALVRVSERVVSTP